MRQRIGRRLGALYLALLVASHGVWWLRDTAPRPGPLDRTLEVPEVVGGRETGRRVRVVYRELGPRDAPVIVLLHGSPGNLLHFWKLADQLGDRYRVIVPDYPGFGRSRQPLGDYSIEAHGHEMAALLAELGVERAHLVGFSMGGGVSLHVADLDPARVASITLLSSIGVQELELFGSYELNHAVHGLQLLLFHAVRHLVPHFGAIDGSPFDLAYPRNFYDTDQRPLRGLFEAYAGPMLIVHGARDFLVPPAAAREHHRIVPQSELEMVEDRSHFLLWTWTDELARRLDVFVQKVESGRATRRGDADPARLAAAAEPFDPASIPPFDGPTLLVAMIALAAATLVSEDLTCIGAGLLVSQGRMGFLAATLACFLGIFVGDLALYLAGRLLGRPALGRAPLRWVVSEASVERARLWFERRGVAVIFLSRFLPGLRLPTYVAAGVVGTRMSLFAFWFVLAGVVWTPLLVALAAWVGGEAGDVLELFGDWALPGVLLLMGGLLLVPRVLVPLFSWRGRRHLLGRLRRTLTWEFWPPWVFYAPVVGWVAWLSVRHGGLGRVTAVNPPIPTGGFIGESKVAILEGLGRDHPHIARFVRIPAGASPSERSRIARGFLAETGLELPVVLKPDVGQRGSGVRILREPAALEAALAELTVDHMLQEFVPGPEFGVFYVRRPGQERGWIFSITEKRLPEVVGDGVHDLEWLILADPRAVAAARVYLEANVARLAQVPAAGERVRLVEIGTHCRGAIFLDGERLSTEALAEAIDGLSKGYPGFWFGRYDLRCETEEALARGQGFKVIELNGLTSEATHIYDPRHSLLNAYRVLFRQWSVAFEIARANLAAGARPSSTAQLVRELLAYRRLQRTHRGDRASPEGSP